MDNSDKNGVHSQDTNCNANIIYTELGPLLLRKQKMEITVASKPPPKRPIIQAMADKNKRQATFALANSNVTKKYLYGEKWLLIRRICRHDCLL